jgi:hypothetical protein
MLHSYTLTFRNCPGATQNSGGSLALCLVEVLLVGYLGGLCSSSWYGS